MDSSTPFNLMIFTDSTKRICTCSAVSIFLIILFIVSPLSNFFMTSTLMKVIILIILAYTIYLNMIQTNYLRSATNVVNSENILAQLNTNILCSYIFTLFLGLMGIFVIKSFIVQKHFVLPFRNFVYRLETLFTVQKLCFTDYKPFLQS